MREIDESSYVNVSRPNRAERRRRNRQQEEEKRVLSQTSVHQDLFGKALALVDQLPESQRPEVRRHVHELQENSNNACAKNYLDTFVRLPNSRSKDVCFGNIQIPKKIFDVIFIGQDKAKRIILNKLWMAFKTGHQHFKVCLVGPPGIGKSKFVTACANIFGRKVFRIRLDTISQASELRGQMPSYQAPEIGEILRGLIESGCINPIFFFDEIDKIPETEHGNAIRTFLNQFLEDQDQKTFYSAYLGIHIDAQDFSFISAVNDMKSFNSRPWLKERLGTLVEMDLYTQEELRNILIEDILPQQEKKCNHQCAFTPDGIDVLLKYYSKIYGQKCAVRILKEDWVTNLFETAFAEEVTHIDANWVTQTFLSFGYIKKLHLAQGSIRKVA